MNAKRFFSKALILAIAAVALSLSAQAQAYLQDPKYGKSPEEREKNVHNLNYFNDAYTNKDYDKATFYLKDLTQSCPKASQNMYINGINIYRSKIAEAKSDADKNLYIDSLMVLYDLRMENFGDHATRGKSYIIGLKARDFLAYKPDDKEGIRAIFQEVLALNGTDVDTDLLNIYFSALVDAYKEDKVTTEYLLNEYDKLAKVFDENTTPEKEEARKIFDALFVSSGAASDCGTLEKIFRPQVEAASSDEALLEKVYRLLAGNKCNTLFQIEVGEKLYAVKPSSMVALSLAAACDANNDPTKARKYVSAAIASETDPEIKSTLSIQIAGTLLNEGKAREAAEFARQAISYNPNNGFGYAIIGQAYAAGSSACSEFDRQSVYWLVVDNLAKASDLLSSSNPEQAQSINSQIAQYRGYFPSNDDCFFRGLQSGSGYNVSCGWVSGHTTVRTR